jgi:uncharacterized protein (TIGR00730 family)
MNYNLALDELDHFLDGETPQLPTEIEQLSRRDASLLQRIDEEFTAGFRIMARRGPSATVFGSARVRPGTPLYELGVSVGRELARAGLTVVTGGGPGLMEAANRGALEAGGVSIGLGITLQDLEPPNRYTTAAVNFRYFFVRKVFLIKYATAFILLPGGLGTLDELFETLNLIQTRKIRPLPVILVGTEFWQGLVDWVRMKPYDGGMLSPKAMELFLLEDDPAAVAQNVVRWMETHNTAVLDRPAVAGPPHRVSA